MTNKLRKTHQREVILQELANCSTHPSADELYHRVKKKLPRISLATVYRNLEILSEAGEIMKIEISGRQKRFDWELTEHNHIYCVRCHRVDNIRLEQSTMIPRPDDDRGYAISGCRIEFLGICPECNQPTKAQGDKEMGCSKCQPDQVTENQRRVLKALAQIGTTCGNKEIASTCGMDAKEVSSQITTLKKMGLVESPVRCKYALTKEGNKAIA